MNRTKTMSAAASDRLTEAAEAELDRAAAEETRRRRLAATTESAGARVAAAAERHAKALREFRHWDSEVRDAAAELAAARRAAGEAERAEHESRPAEPVLPPAVRHLTPAVVAEMDAFYFDLRRACDAITSKSKATDSDLKRLAALRGALVAAADLPRVKDPVAEVRRRRNALSL